MTHSARQGVQNHRADQYSRSDSDIARGVVLGTTTIPTLRLPSYLIDLVILLAPNNSLLFSASRGTPRQFSSPFLGCDLGIVRASVITRVAMSHQPVLVIARASWGSHEIPI